MKSCLKRLLVFFCILSLVLSVPASAKTFSASFTEAGFTYPDSWSNGYSQGGMPYYHCSIYPANKITDRQLHFRIADLTYYYRTYHMEEEKAVQSIMQSWIGHEKIPISGLQPKIETIGNYTYTVYSGETAENVYDFYILIENGMLYGFFMVSPKSALKISLQENKGILQSFRFEPVDRNSFVNRFRAEWRYPLTESPYSILGPMLVILLMMIFCYFIPVFIVHQMRKRKGISKEHALAVLLISGAAVYISAMLLSGRYLVYSIPFLILAGCFYYRILRKREIRKEFCDRCGRKLEPGSNVCLHCGIDQGVDVE